MTPPTAYYSRRIFLGLSLCLILLSQIIGQHSGVATERFARLDAYLRTEIERGNLPGAVTWVFKDGKVIHHTAQGFRDAEAKIPMEKDDLFYIQSMTKPIISLAFMLLYEEGKFLLSDPVSRYLPEFRNMRVIRNREEGVKGQTDSLISEITLGQLLSHTAGLTHGLGQDRFDREFMAGYFMNLYPNVQARVAKITAFPLFGQPGRQWRYSAAPDVLSALIEKLSGQTTDEFLRNRIFVPLGMNHTYYNVPDADLPRVVKLHTRGNPIRLARSQSPRQGVRLWSGVNGLYATAEDYGIFCQMLLKGGSFNGKTIIGKKTLELMTANHSGKMFNRPGEGFGLGFAMVTDLAATQLPGSEGLFYWGGANNTHFFVDPHEGLVAVLMSQESNFSWEYHDRLRQLVYQALVPAR